MALLLPLLEWLLPLVALAVCSLAYAFAAPIVNFVHTGITWFDKAIAYLTNKAIDLGIEFTKWIGPYFTDAINRQVGNLHQLGELSHYAAHFAWRTATSVYNWNHWLLKSYLPKELRFQSTQTVTKANVSGRTQPFSKSQLQRLANTLEAEILRKIEAVIPRAAPLHWPKLNWSVKKWRAWLGLTAGAGALALPGSTAWERAKWKEQNRTNTQTHKRFRTLNWLLAFTGAAALVAAGLAKLGLGWMSRCTNLKKIGPAFCGADLAGLIGLFGTLAVIEGNFSIVQMAEGMLAVEKQMVKLVGGAFSELDGIV